MIKVYIYDNCIYDDIDREWNEVPNVKNVDDSGTYISPSAHTQMITTSDTTIVKKEEKILLYCEHIHGINRPTNWFWLICLGGFGIGFFLTGLSSYVSHSYKSDYQNIQFFPQGIAMIFYGSVAIFSSLLLFFNISRDIGSGENVYDCQDKVVRLTRKSLPKIKNLFELTYPKIFLSYNFSEVKFLELKIITGLNPEHMCYLVLKDERRIPLPLSNPIGDLKFAESRAILLAKILEIELKM